MAPIELAPVPRTYRVTFISVLAAVFGILSLCFTAYLAIERHQYLTVGKMVDAKVLSIEKERGTRAHVATTRARIEFRTAEGKVVQTWVSDGGSSTDIKAIGGEIRIRYLPENPEHPQTEASLGVTFNYFVFLLLGLGFLYGSYRSARSPGKPSLDHQRFISRT
ncbi:MAG: DUF3592 domain-containing protein [Betaproteobacteria bacterium]